ncbi:MAG: hypothetical protein K2J34_09785, partial [Muribaculaceae bacterium]|nr:hypothetical protein [Muribaculaceae bacterium]
PNGGWTSQHQMSINGKFDNITRKDLIEFANRVNIKNADSVIEEIINCASLWPTIARECDVPQKMVDAILPEMRLNLKRCLINGLKLICCI